MNAPDDLLGLFANWRRLTEREGCAILGRDWKSVAEYQKEKQRLHLEMTCALELVHSRKPAAGNHAGKGEHGLESIVSELIELETRNRDLLSAKSQTKRAELQRLDGAARDLQSVRRAYGTSPSHHRQSCS